LILSYEYKGYKTTASIDLENYQTKIEYYDKDFASIKEFIAYMQRKIFSMKEFRI